MRSPTLAFALACALVFALTAACGGKGGAAPTPSAFSPTATAAQSACPPASATSAAGTASHTLTSAGISRTYLLHVPAGYTGLHPIPLVIALHPYAGNARLMLDLTRFETLSDSAGFVVAAPDGTGSPQFWNVQQAPGAADDVMFARDLIGAVSRDLCVDQDGVFATGYSNGGGMALRLACALPDQIAAVGVVASVYVACDANAPLIAFHGTQDRILPFEGGADPDGSPVALPSVRRAVSEWARQLGCDGLAQISVLSSEVELSTYQRCAQGAGEALLYTILGGGHTWPGAAALPESIVGKTTQQLDATRLIWEFFTAHPRR